MRKSIIVAVPLVLALASCGIFRGGGDKDKSKLAGERLAVLNYEARTTADPDLANTTVALPPPIVNADWTQPGGSAAKALGHLSLRANPSRAWSVSIGSGSDRTKRLTSGPVVSGGRVYTIDTQAVVRAFSAANGGQLWSATLRKEGESENVAFGGGVATDGGRVYATSGYGLVAAYDATSGAEAWRVDIGVPLRGAPSVEGTQLFVMTQDNQLQVLSTATGETLWENAATVEPAGLLGTASPAIALGTAVVGFSSGELLALRIENGRSVWQDALNRTGSTTSLAALSDIDAPAVISDGRVYAIGHGGRMVALDLSTGQRVWERNLAGTSMPWVAGEYIFAVTVDGELVAVQRADGRVRWVTQLQRWRNVEKRKNPIMWQGPVLASDRLYLVNSEGDLVTVSPTDGTVLSTTGVAKDIFIQPAVADNTLYILSEDGRLSAYR
ncbi:PQQ-like beta-propeller repeat protein [Sphingosinicella soli]|uniref:Outer membrane protein assembly factor BamB n=1 Tax=Sphingosinicella soli TaxID=333708 RepID=A0A7W7F741_9SPHN|nr:PQQ-like beta-propeller repeat protein [Sphingosinicella soli]MBB4633230.1 outer membrane protein assembly factor BamB [Sphingosinicella soli]